MSTMIRTAATASKRIGKSAFKKLIAFVVLATVAVTLSIVAAITVAANIIK